MSPRPDFKASQTHSPPRIRFDVWASVSLIALIFLCLLWELRLAPVQPGGSWLALKCLPLLLPLRGILHGRRYTYRWAALFILAYFTEGILRWSTDSAPGQWLAAAEVVLALVFFGSSIAYLRQPPASGGD